MSRNCKLRLEPANDDTIQCLFFITNDLGSNTSLKEDLCKQLNNTIQTLTKGYIWHQDEFQVYVPIVDYESEIPSHLCSVTCFGDNLEDEWFIVHILLEISKQYKNLIIQVKDNDGDFLLIEAANYLQSWANPENTDNRVFIADNHIHLIPPVLADLQMRLELNDALKFITKTPELTRASNDIQQAIMSRIGNYPEKIFENIHRAVVKLPLKLAALLTLKPTLIAPFVDAYCNHDIIDAKCCKSIDFNDCVTIEIKFTKFLYAKLMHAKLINYAKHLIVKENEKQTTLGLKIMYGFQMIMNKAIATDKFSSKEYHKFLNNLKQNGYFKNNIEGSKEYTLLVENARHYFSTVESPVNSNISLNISELLMSSDFTSIQDTLKNKSTNPHGYIEDNEDWLNVQPDQLNDLLSKRYGTKSKLKNNDVISSQTLTQELSSFLKRTSDFEGIEPNHLEESESNNIDFEADQFVTCLEKMLKILSTGSNEDAASDESEEDIDNMYYDEDDIDDDSDRELKAELQLESNDKLKDNRTVLDNIIQSMKEEKASTGPSSNLMRSLGVSKTELLDSDDD